MFSFLGSMYWSSLHDHVKKSSIKPPIFVSLYNLDKALQREKKNECFIDNHVMKMVQKDHKKTETYFFYLTMLIFAAKAGNFTLFCSIQTWSRFLRARSNVQDIPRVFQEYSKNYFINQLLPIGKYSIEYSSVCSRSLCFCSIFIGIFQEYFAG